MKKLLKVLLWLIGILVGLLLVGFLVGYLATMGDYKIAETVEYDDSLPRLEINNTLLHGETYGEDSSTVVIVLHGGPGQDYRYLLPLTELANAYHVVFFDQRGSGLSARVPAEELTLDIFIEDLKAIVDTFSEGRSVFLIGHSWGAMLASAYLGRYPETIAKAVLMEPGFLTSEMGNELMEKANYFQPEMNLETLIKVIALWFRSLHVDAQDDQAGIDFFMEELILNTEIENHPMAGYFCDRDLKNSYTPVWRMGALASQTFQKSAMNEEGRINISLIDGVEDFKEKVLFISGSCNTLIGPEYQRRQMQYFPVSELVIIEDAGHTMIGEKPDETIEVIRKYFRE